MHLFRGMAACALALTGFIALTPGEASACPQPGSATGSLSATSTQLYRAVTQTVTARGDTALRNCNIGPFSGQIASQGHYILEFANTDNYALEMRAQGGCDTVLLVHTPAGQWLWDDDSAGNLDPLLRLRAAPSGRYTVWVGTVSAGTCTARLHLETFP